MVNLSKLAKSSSPLVISVFLAFSTSFAAHPRIAEDLNAADPASTVDVIVQYKTTPTRLHHQHVINRGGRFTRSLAIVNAGAYRIPASALEALANDPEVAHISADHVVQSTGKGLDYHLEAVHGDNASWNGFDSGDGGNIGVAIIDSGISAQKDVAGQLVHSETFVRDGVTDDLYGHGTHVAGIVAGNGQASSGSGAFYTFRGIAPAANLINLRVLDRNGVGSDSTVIAGIQQAIALKNQYRIRVINLSLGRPVFESYTLDPLCQAVEAAWKAGIVVVAAAGNEGRNNSAQTNGYATITAPGNDPYVITVGAMKTAGTPGRGDDLIASYSAKGPTLFDHIVKPDIVAPGNRVISTMAGSSYFRNNCSICLIPQSLYMAQNPATNSDQYLMLSGTSMATPVVSGAAALLIQQDPSLSPDQVKARLMKTSTKNFPAVSTALDPATGVTYTSYYDIFTIGAGYLDITAALANRDSAKGTAMSPAATYNSATGQVTLLSGAGSVWGSNVVWGASVVWGSNTILGSNVIWGSNVVWGASSMQGFSVVWGANVIWGSNTQNTSESLAIAVNGEN
jgi:serine protease AprX